MNLFKKRSKLNILQQQLKELRKKRFNARKIKEHHAREMKRDIEKDDLKAYEKHAIKHRFHNQKLEIIRAKFRKVEEEIKIEKARLEQLAYQRQLKVFNNTMVDKLMVLYNALQTIVERLELSNITNLANELYDYFENNKRPFNREILVPYNMLGLLSIKIRTGHIVEEFGDMQKISSTRGSSVAAQKRQNVITWTSQLASQIKDCVSTIKERS